MKKYYMFDHRIVTAENAELVYGNIKKERTDAFWGDQYARTSGTQTPDWEHRISILYPYVLYQENGVGIDGGVARYKLWYHSWKSGSIDWVKNIIDRENSNNIDLGGAVNKARGSIYPGDHAVCYMESEDGIRWRRPDCGEFFYKTSEGSIIGTNIVFIGNHGPGVSLNLHPDKTREPRFLLAAAAEDTTDKGVAISRSQDGIHWERPFTIKSGKTTDTNMLADTHNQIIWSPELGRYVVTSRGWVGERVVVQFTSKDQFAISENAVFPRNGYEYYYKENEKNWEEPEITVQRTMNAQPYSMPIARISEGYYLGVVSVADFDKQTEGRFQSVHAELMWSYDAVHWFDLLGGTPFIANADSFAFEAGNDYGMIYSAAPVITKDETKFFYAALPEPHYFSFDQIPEQIVSQMNSYAPRAVKTQAITRSPSLNFVSVKNDKIAGYYSSNGTVQVGPVDVSEIGVKIVSDISPDGSISAAFLNENGAPLDGFSHSDFIGLSADGYIIWKDRDRNRTKQLRVTVEIKLYDATVFAIITD